MFTGGAFQNYPENTPRNEPVFTEVLTECAPVKPTINIPASLCGLQCRDYLTEGGGFSLLYSWHQADQYHIKVD